jgi:hypothetical protein
MTSRYIVVRVLAGGQRYGVSGELNRQDAMAKKHELDREQSRVRTLTARAGERLGQAYRHEVRRVGSP